jgi:hypothetical protein
MKTLLHDNFQALPLGPFPSEYTAIGEYHYETHKGRLNHWYESTNWHGWRKRVRPDILSLHDCRGKKLFEFEPTHKGNLLSPVNWTGDGVELALLNGHPVDGGLIDGYGRNVVMFPDDGHPDVCAEALDLNNDGLDEIVLWDRDRIWVYTRNQAIDRKRLYAPIRWPHWNNSNYRGEISLPCWKEAL